MTSRPRFVTSGRASDLEALLRPVPSVVADAVGQPAEQHAQLARRYGEARSRLIAARAELDEAERADHAAAQRAIVTGQPMPKPKADKIRVELAEAEREVDVVVELIPASAQLLLDAALDVVHGVEQKADADADAAVADALDHLRAARESLEVDAALRSASAFCADLRESGSVRPFSTRTTAGRGALAIAEAVRAVEDQQQRRAAYAEQSEHERIAANAVPIEGGYRVLAPPPLTQ